MTVARTADPSRAVRPLLAAAATALVGSLLALGALPEASDAAGCKKTRVGGFKLKKVKVSDPVSCQHGRWVAKKWVKRGYDDLNPISHGGDIWFCSWRRRAPQSTTTGTAECDADPDQGIKFAVRRR
jgi:hypothetical protein